MKKGKNYHIKCDGTTRVKYNYYHKSKEDDPNTKLIWHCLYCTMKFHHKHIPFTLCDTSDLNNLNNSDNMKYSEHFPKLETIYETSK